MGNLHATSGTPISIDGGSGGGAGYENGPTAFTLTQTNIDNGVTLSPAPTSISTMRMTLDEQGGNVQAPGVDYTLDVALIEFTASMKSRLYPGYSIRMEWS